MCFDAVIDASGYGKILMTYSIEGVEKLLPNSDLSGELEFKTAVLRVGMDLCRRGILPVRQLLQDDVPLLRYAVEPLNVQR